MHYHGTESTVLEFKEKIPQNNQIVKTAIGFCNVFGGRIIIGVKDDGEVIGIEDSIIDSMIESLSHSIYNSSTPPIYPKIYTQRFENEIVLVIEVSEGMNKPYFRTSEGIERGTYIRMGRSTLRASDEIIQELRWLAKGKRYDELPMYSANRNELDENLMFQFLTNRKHEFKSDLTDDVLISYNILTKEQSRLFPTIGALLLFGKDPQKYLPESFIICTHFQGIAGRKAISAVDCTGNIVQQIDEALQFIFSRLYRSYSIEGIQRNEKLEIPEVAVREILVNAVVHRNYMIDGPIKISIYEDRIEFFSPGLFPGPLDVNNLEQGITYIRNSVITKVFREAGIIEKLGSGFILLFSSYRDRGLEKPTVIEGLNFIKCVLPRKKAMEADYGKMIPDDQVKEEGSTFNAWTLNIVKATSDDDIILRLFQKSDEITMSMVLKRTGWARATAGRRLKRLLDAEKIIKIGAGRFCRYQLRSNGSL